MSNGEGLYVFSLAVNCLEYEADPGPELVNVGSDVEPRVVRRGEALRHLYARSLLEHLGAEPALVAVAERCCVSERNAMEDREYWVAVRDRRAAVGDPNADEALTEAAQRRCKAIWQCALDLCYRAADLLGEADLADDRDRQRFLAAIGHQNTVDILGGVPGVEQASARLLIDKLRDVDDAHA